MKNQVRVTALGEGLERLREQGKALGELLLYEEGLTHVTFDVYFVTDDIMKHNVLSYPWPKDFPMPEVKGLYLGELYINPSHVQKHGENLSFMFIHGFLHLLGYVHEKLHDRIRMEERERELLKSTEICHISS